MYEFVELNKAKDAQNILAWKKFNLKHWINQVILNYI